MLNVHIAINFFDAKINNISLIYANIRRKFAEKINNLIYNNLKTKNDDTYY
ncbi:hypothetical protein FACS189413_08610 [Bacteroidia bacterium]|nr:hypothetical protein FACS189413_08610 [Bacteroidia bacterium]